MTLADDMHRSQNASGESSTIKGMLMGAFLVLFFGVIFAVFWTRGCGLFRTVDVPWRVTISGTEHLTDASKIASKREDVLSSFRKSKNDANLELTPEFVFKNCDLSKYGFKDDRLLLTTAENLANKQDSAIYDAIIKNLKDVFSKDLHAKFVLTTPQDTSPQDTSEKEEHNYLFEIVIAYVPDYTPDPPIGMPAETFQNEVKQPSISSATKREEKLIKSLGETKQTGIALRVGPDGDGDHFDVVLQYLLRTELARMQHFKTQGIDNWLPVQTEALTMAKLESLQILGSRNEDKAKKFKNRFFVMSSDGTTMGDPYRESYCRWIDVLMQHNLSLRTEAEWNKALDSLILLSENYAKTKTPTGGRDGETYRIDGSVLNLALYTAVTLRIENQRLHMEELEPYFNKSFGKGSGSRFDKLATNLITTAHNHDGGLVDDELDPKFATFTSYANRSNLVGGKFLCYSLQALLAIDNNNMEDARRSMERALTLKKVFSKNRAKSTLSAYAYCYLMRSAITNARICSRIEIDEDGEQVYADSWTKEWLDFAAELDAMCSEPAFDAPPGHANYSNYYWYLAQLAYINGISDEVKHWNGRKGQ